MSSPRGPWGAGSSTKIRRQIYDQPRENRHHSTSSGQAFIRIVSGAHSLQFCPGHLSWHTSCSICSGHPSLIRYISHQGLSDFLRIKLQIMAINVFPITVTPAASKPRNSHKISFSCTIHATPKVVVNIAPRVRRPFVKARFCSSSPFRGGQ